MGWSRNYTLILIVGLGSLAACVAIPNSPQSAQQPDRSVPVRTNARGLRLITPPGPFRLADTPPPPDYTDQAHWAALPGRLDAADITPRGIASVPPEARDADVFFIHPTTYFGRTWNQPLDHARTNARTDKGTMRNQTSVFNGCCRIYAPRYRQATVAAFLKSDPSAQQATEFAYADVRKAFQYYLEHYNQGRPFIIASHSQGSYHALRLLEDEVDGTPRLQRFIAAYVIGNGIAADWFKRQVEDISLCRGAKDTGCVVAWSTWLEGSAAERTRVDIVRHYDEGWESNFGKQITCTNPLTWTTGADAALAAANIGAWSHGKGKQADAPDPGVTGARCEDGALYISAPKIQKYNARVRADGNYHSMDYQLFFMNIWRNVQERARAFVRQ